MPKKITRQFRGSLQTIVALSRKFCEEKIEIKEEVEVITTADLIGSVGGSCGMFFGFFISAYVLFIMEKILDRISALMKETNPNQIYNVES